MTEAQFPGVPQSVVSARRFAANALRDVPGEVSEAVALIASELASNSVRHAASAFEVRVEQLPDEIHIEVEDDGGGEPAVRSPGLSDTSGRGLQIVQALADEWGVVPNPAATGKTVWVRIALPAPDTWERSRRRDRDAAGGAGSTGRGTGSPGGERTVSPATGHVDPSGAAGRCRWSGRDRAGRPCVHRCGRRRTAMHPLAIRRRRRPRGTSPRRPPRPLARSDRGRTPVGSGRPSRG